ncbi:MAG: phage tail tape measure protein, partial [Fusobacteriaceae bacterium]
MANEKQISFNIGASLAPSFKQSFGKANEALGVLEKSSNRFKLQQKQMSEEMARLYKNIDASPEKIKKLDEAMRKNREEVVKSRERLIQLRQQMRNGDPENKLGTEYSSLRTKLVGLNKQYKNNELQKNKIGTITIEERKRVSLLINDYNELGKTISKTDKIKNQYARAAKMSSVGGGMKTAGNKMMMAGGIGAGLLTPIMSQTIQAESAFADVKKQFDFVNAEEEKIFKTELNKLIKEKKMAISLPDLYAAAASAGQSGLNKETAIPYVEQSIKMSIAFDMAREEAAVSMFKMKNAFNMPLEDLKTLIDQINYLSNTTGSTAPQITDYLLRVGNIAATANLSAASTSALGATL